MKPKIESGLVFCCNGYIILTEGVTDKNHPERNLPGKKNPDQPPNKNPRELTQTPCKDMYVCCMYY